MTLRSFVLVLLVAMASAMTAAAGGVDTRTGERDKNMDSRLQKLEKKIAALAATKTESSKQVRRRPRARRVRVREHQALLPLCDSLAHLRRRS